MKREGAWRVALEIREINRGLWVSHALTTVLVVLLAVPGARLVGAGSRSWCLAGVLGCGWFLGRVIAFWQSKKRWLRRRIRLGRL
jgi:hypothetical protein